MKVNIEGVKIEVAEPVSEKLQGVWNGFSRLLNWIPPGVNKSQMISAIATELNAWHVQAFLKAGKCKIDYGSAAKSAMNTCCLGLVPGQAKGHSYFVPMEVDKKNQRHRIECQLWIGYRGFLELGWASNWLSTVTTEVVLSGEEFHRWNDEDGAHYRHEIPLNRDLSIENVEAAYCVTISKDGGKDFEIVERSVLMSLASRGNVWRSAPIEMCRKTAIRAASKRWRQTQPLANAVRLDEQSERDESQVALGLVDEDPVDPGEVPTPIWADELSQRLDEADLSEIDKIQYEFSSRCESEEERKVLADFCQQWKSFH